MRLTGQGCWAVLPRVAFRMRIYPAEDRGAGPTFTRVAWGLPFGALDHVIDEFGPDLERLFLRKK